MATLSIPRIRIPDSAESADSATVTASGGRASADAASVRSMPSVPSVRSNVPSVNTVTRGGGTLSHAGGRSRANSAASVSFAAALASGAAEPPRPMSPTLLSPPRPTSPLPPHPTISIPPSIKIEEKRPPDINAPPPAEDATALRQLAHYSGLVLSAMLGTLIRLGLDAIGTYDGRVIFPLAWAQGVGCGIMGIAAARKNQLYWWYPPLHTFIGTGIAGSVTTFSAWMLEEFLAFANFVDPRYRRSGFYDAVDGVAYGLATLAISVACLFMGYHVASFLPNLPTPPASWQTRGHGQSSPNMRRTLLLDYVFLLSALLAYLAAALLYGLGPTFWRHRVTFALLLAPPGAMLRYLLSRLNTLPPVNGRFPLGTFTANMIATLIVSGVFAAQHRPPSYTNAVHCDGMYALQQGFCGCLSTVSTFVVEVTTLKQKRWRWTYLWTSVLLGQVFVLAVLGGVKWGEGLGEVCRGTD